MISENVKIAIAGGVAINNYGIGDDG